MYENLNGKRLLILGCSMNESIVVETAQSLGVYTIVTDNHSDWAQAPAKYIADEAWDISWSEIEALASKCRERNVDGVLAGFSEFKTDNARKLCVKMGFPFYIENDEQLVITRDKELFKDTCRKYGIPVAKEYDVNTVDTDSIGFPVIVKPTDNAGSRGIRICRSREELHGCIEYALSFSLSKRVIIEEFVVGKIISLSYTISNGFPMLSYILDKYEKHGVQDVNTIPDAYVFPSIHINTYCRKYDDAFKRMIKDLKIDTGIFNVQGFVREDGSMVFFEAGFRLTGSKAFLLTDYCLSVSNLKMLIHHSLTGCTNNESMYEDATFSGKKACLFHLSSKEGVISALDGNTEACSLPNVIRAFFCHQLGEEICYDGSQYPISHNTFIVADTLDELKTAIEQVKKTVKIYDEYGNDMVLRDFDTDRIVM